MLATAPSAGAAAATSSTIGAGGTLFFFLTAFVFVSDASLRWLRLRWLREPDVVVRVPALLLPCALALDDADALLDSFGAIYPKQSMATFVHKGTKLRVSLKTLVLG